MKILSLALAVAFVWAVTAFLNWRISPEYWSTVWRLLAIVFTLFWWAIIDALLDDWLRRRRERRDG